MCRGGWFDSITPYCQACVWSRMTCFPPGVSVSVLPREVSSVVGGWPCKPAALVNSSNSPFSLEDQ